MIQRLMTRDGVSSWTFNIGIFLLRLVAGVAFIFHGMPKVENATSWMGPDSPIPPFFQAAAAVSEFVGGFAWIFGLLFVPFSALLGVTMAVATSFHVMKGDPFVGKGGSYELALVYLVLSVFFLMVGPGKISADRVLFKR